VCILKLPSATRADRSFAFGGNQGEEDSCNMLQTYWSTSMSVCGQPEQNIQLSSALLCPTSIARRERRCDPAMETNESRRLAAKQ
jgi:hypothetical protein